MNTAKTQVNQISLVVDDWSGMQKQVRGSIEQIKNATAVAIYDDYEDAQRAVDYLSDRQFPVQRCAIVGTDLRSFEKVTGRLTWGRVIGLAAVQGLVWGLGFGILMSLFWPNGGTATLISAVVIFLIINILTSSFAYQFTGRQRDFTSTTQIVATHYEIVVESSHAYQARTLLAGDSPRLERAPYQHESAEQPTVDTQAGDEQAPRRASSSSDDDWQGGAQPQTFDPRPNREP